MIVMDRKTVCTSTQGTIAGKDVIGQNTTISLRFGNFFAALLLTFRIIFNVTCPYH